MGSYDGAESCELVGAYLLHDIKEEFSKACNFGLYRMTASALALLVLLLSTLPTGVHINWYIHNYVFSM